MPSTKEYLNFILEQLSQLDDISHRAKGRSFDDIPDEAIAAVEQGQSLILCKPQI